MANIDLGNLTRYDGKIKQYAENKYLSKNTANWQMTEKAGAVTCYPVPDTELEPIVDFSFKETLLVNGEKSPSNPSVITGISSITITRCETTGVNETQYVVNLDNTYYGGSVNLATGELIVTWEGIVLTGSEAVTTDVVHNGTYYHYSIPVLHRASALMTTATRVSSHYPFGNHMDQNVLHFACTQTTIHFFVTQETSASLKSWWESQYESENPVIVCYQLETPYSIQLDSVQIKSLTALDKNTPRLNTLYTDADSIQVGYQKHPARTAYELENAILALGGGE